MIKLRIKEPHHHSSIQEEVKRSTIIIRTSSDSSKIFIFLNLIFWIHFWVYCISSFFEKKFGLVQALSWILLWFDWWAKIKTNQSWLLVRRKTITCEVLIGNSEKINWVNCEPGKQSYTVLIGKSGKTNWVWLWGQKIIEL